jgi:hypothetical protein
MENRVKYLELEKMHFMSDTTEICIIGKVVQGALSYLSELRVDSSLINRILNKIQAQNPNLEIGELLQSEQLANGDCYYEMNFEGMSAMIEFHEFDQVHKYIQIRA